MHRHTLDRSLRAATVTLTGLAAAVLVGCGGGGGGETPLQTAQAPTAPALTAVYFTDDFSARYDAVWITVTRVTAVGPSGETELAAYTPARPFNLPALRQAGALVAKVPVPADTTSVRVYVQPQAQLQQLDGSLLDLPLAAPNGWLEFRLEGWAVGSGVLALDFDLPRFALQGQQLVPATRLASNDDFAGWNQRTADVEGTVLAVATDRVTVQTRHYGTAAVLLDANTTYWSQRSGSTWRPAAGDRIEIAAAVAGQGSTLSYTALTVKDETDAAAAGLGKIEGMITAYDGTSITLSVRDSQLAGATGSVLINVASAAYTRGSAALLAPGVKVEAHVAAQGASWVASALEVDGAPKTGTGHHDDTDVAELKGRIDSVSGSVVTLTALYAERLPGVQVGSKVTVDLAKAYFKKGSAACLVAGAPIEIKGSVGANGALQPVKAEIEGGCATAYPAPGITPPGNATPPPVAAFVEAKGTITALRAGEFDIAVYRLSYAGAAAATLTVRYGPATVFKYPLPASLVAGQFVEVKGMLTGTVIEASKVELD
ncbi:MAG: DUF5666 domain-containing protein [Rubrivivax sp.]|nr:DUF5666 domain-containing protein [Rubrivivax sp.]